MVIALRKPLTNKERVDRVTSIQAMSLTAMPNGHQLGIARACKKSGIAKVTYYKDRQKVAHLLIPLEEKIEEVKNHREIINDAFKDHDFPDPKHYLDAEQKSFIAQLSKMPQELIICKTSGITVNKMKHWLSTDIHFKQAFFLAKEEAEQLLQSQMWASATGDAKSTVNVSAAREVIKMSQDSKQERRKAPSSVKVRNKIKI